MPQLYNNAVITDAGLSLLDRAQAGTASIQFTRMATGSGTYTADEKTSSALKKRTALKSEKNSYPLSSVGTVPDGGVKLTALITNQDPATGATLVNEGYNINEIGLYAKEKAGDSSTEILYSITVATYDTGDYIPPYGDGAPVQIVQEYHAKVGNAVSVTVSYMGAVMLAEDAQREFEDLKRMIDEGGAMEGKTLTFEEAKARENIASGDRMDTILGKIKKFFADLRRVAFTGSYNDLVDKPDIPTVPGSLPASNVTSTYSSTGTDPVNGKAVNAALGTLDVASKGGAGKYIQSISETDGKITAVEATMPTSLPADGGNASTVGGKTAADLLDYRNLTNKPDPADIGAVKKTGDTMTGYLKLEGAGLDIVAPDTTGSHARGAMFFDKDGTGIKGGIGVFGNAGVISHIYLALGTTNPWSAEAGISITKDSIKWKNKELQTKGTVVNATLPADGWTGTEAPFTLTVTRSEVTAGSIINIDVASAVTSEQLDAFVNAKIVDGGQSNGSFILKAFGEKPAVPIPIKIEIR